MSERSSLSGTLSFADAKLGYTVEGVGIPAIVIGSALYYPRTFSQELRKGLRMAFVDLRHFAETSLPASKTTLETYLTDIEQVRQHLGIDRAVIIGHSHHGNLALEYAKRYPKRSSHVVLIGSPPVEVMSVLREAEAYWEGHASASRKALLKQRLVALQNVDLQQLAPERAFVLQYLAESPKYWFDPAYDATHLWEGMPINMNTVAAFRDFFANGYTLSWDPKLLPAPVLVVMGRHDYAVPHTLWADAWAELPNLTLHLFEKSGHSPQLEEPELFDRLLREWLASST